jgi:hypothetical protein
MNKFRIEMYRKNGGSTARRVSAALYAVLLMQAAVLAESVEMIDFTKPVRQVEPAPMDGGFASNHKYI